MSAGFDIRLAALLIGLSVLALGCAAANVSAPEQPGILVPCTANADADGDGLSDSCELELARAFAPTLRVSSSCNWDTSVEPARPGGEYYFAAQPLGTASVRLLYLPAYYQDCGWRGFKCKLPGQNCRGHSGDSELMAIDVERGTTQHWRTTGVFLSAHCFGRSSANCRWYRDQELNDFDWADQQRGAPQIWVAAGKNAHYPSRSACDAGHWFYDTCDDNQNSLRYPILSLRQNIGSRGQPVGNREGCVDARAAGWTSSLVSPQVTECFWSDTMAFTGWQRPARGSATPYARYLRELGLPR